MKYPKKLLLKRVNKGGMTSGTQHLEIYYMEAVEGYEDKISMKHWLEWTDQEGNLQKEKARSMRFSTPTALLNFICNLVYAHTYFRVKRKEFKHLEFEISKLNRAVLHATKKCLNEI